MSTWRIDAHLTGSVPLLRSALSNIMLEIVEWVAEIQKTWHISITFRKPNYYWGCNFLRRRICQNQNSLWYWPL